ncbi:MAG: RNA polymerase subunit sigma-24, partial [Ruminococcus sp.]|nr:RNA polymerase subunit sigma-24 [Ruminococcus sp.]
LRCAVNKCKNHLKSGWISKTVPLDDSVREIADGSGEDGDSARLVLEAVNGLPEKYRTVIHLFYYSGLSIAEIASVKGMSTATVGTHLARGRDLLRKRLGDDF